MLRYFLPRDIEIPKESESQAHRKIFLLTSSKVGRQNQQRRGTLVETFKF